VVPFAAGGSTDVSARIMTGQLEKLLQKQIVIENKPGASGNIGAAFTAQAAPNGCTLMVTSALIGMYPYLFPKLDYDPLKALVAIGGISTAATLLVTSSASPMNDVRDLISASKAKPDGLSYATPGYGTPQHLVTEDIAERAGAKFVHVPYRGGGLAMTDL